MKLADWLYESSVTPGQLRRMLGVDRTTVHRYLIGSRIPQPHRLQRIFELTKGRVRLEDFLDPSPPECARQVPRPDGSMRLVLPWSGDGPAEPPGTPASDRLSAPVLRAIEVLSGRAWFTPAGTFLLDGRQADPRRIVIAANDVLRKRGDPPIAYPGVENLP
ncbi:MAG: hypothetical protein RBS39_06480 [Phycisphaerales bacterium]|jgi:hypothetical protein|nr:hypothetical protein [Phycisphaerales bacterium]